MSSESQKTMQSSYFFWSNAPHSWSCAEYDLIEKEKKKKERKNKYSTFRTLSSISIFTILSFVHSVITAANVRHIYFED